jgi:hypothetical protein
VIHFFETGPTADYVSAAPLKQRSGEINGGTLIGFEEVNPLMIKANIC